MSGDQNRQFSIDVVLALPTACHRRTVDCRPGASVAEIVAASELSAVCVAATGGAPMAYGIYGRKVSAQHVAQQGDRIELLRGLQVDPRAARRARASRR